MTGSFQATHLSDRCTSTNDCPHRLWHGNRPHFGHIRTFGCLAYALVHCTTAGRPGRTMHICRPPTRRVTHILAMGQSPTQTAPHRPLTLRQERTTRRRPSQKGRLYHQGKPLQQQGRQQQGRNRSTEQPLNMLLPSPLCHQQWKLDATITISLQRWTSIQSTQPTADHTLAG